jgi:hypothetical protein
MSKFEKFDEIMRKLLALVLLSLFFMFVGWGIIIFMRWLEKAVLG